MFGVACLSLLLVSEVMLKYTSRYKVLTPLILAFTGDVSNMQNAN
jgi:hypothetical protein